MSQRVARPDRAGNYYVDFRFLKRTAELPIAVAAAVRVLALCARAPDRVAQVGHTWLKEHAGVGETTLNHMTRWLVASGIRVDVGHAGRVSTYHLTPLFDFDRPFNWVKPDRLGAQKHEGGPPRSKGGPPLGGGGGSPAEQRGGPLPSEGLKKVKETQIKYPESVLRTDAASCDAARAGNREHPPEAEPPGPGLLNLLAV